MRRNRCLTHHHRARQLALVVALAAGCSAVPETRQDAAPDSRRDNTPDSVPDSTPDNTPDSTHDSARAEVSSGATGGSAPSDAANDTFAAADSSAANDAMAAADAAPASDAGLPPVPTNTRLQARQLEVDGAPALALGVWDTKEKIHCNFVPDENGQLRCLPDVAKVLIPTENFTDAKCTTPLTWIQPDQKMTPINRTWTWQQAQKGCAPVRYQVLRPLPIANPIYGLKNGSCKALVGAEQAPPAPGDLPFRPDAPEGWELGVETVTLRLSDRLRVVEIVTPDGARFVKTLADDRWNMSCILRPGSTNGTIECAPPMISTIGSFFTDQECKLPIFEVPACSQAAFIDDFQKRYALNGPFVGPVYYGAKSCDLRTTATVADGAPHYFTRGDVLGSDAVAPAFESITGSGRFRLRGLKRDDGTFIAIPLGLLSYTSAKYFDSVANEDCSPMWDVDGRVRCIPSSTLIDTVTYFADSACTRFIVYCTGGITCETRKVIRAIRDANFDIRANIVYGAANRLDTTDIFYLDGVSCRQIGGAVKDMIEPKNEISIDVFPLLQERYPLPAGR